MSLIEIGHGITFPESYWLSRNQQLFPDSLLALLDSFGYEAQTVDGKSVKAITVYGEIVARKKISAR